MGAATSVSLAPAGAPVAAAPAPPKPLSALTVDDVAEHVASLDAAAWFLSALEAPAPPDARHMMEAESSPINWVGVSEALRAGRVDGELLSVHRAYDVDGLEGLLAPLVGNKQARQRLVEEIETRFFKRSKAEEQRSAAKLKKMIAGTSAMTRCAALDAFEVSFDAADAVRRRRARVRGDAKKALEGFAKLRVEERQSPRRQGALELYTDASLEKRELLRTHPRVVKLLDQWWLGATAYFSDDDSSSSSSELLPIAGYAEFHRKMAGVIERGAGKLFEDDYEQVLQADVEALGDEVVVSRESFCDSLFQAVDQWTASLELQEYLDFLAQAYQAVFGDLEDKDRPRIPDSLETACLEIVGEDGYAARDHALDFDLADWLDAPDLLLDLTETPCEVFDASDLKPDTDELDNHLDFYELLDDDDDDYHAEQQQQQQPRRRASSSSVISSSALACSTRGATDSKRAHQKDPRRSTDNTTAALSPRRRHSVGGTVGGVHLLADKAADEVRGAATTCSEEQSQGEQQQQQQQRGHMHISDVAHLVRGRVVVIAGDARPHVLAKQIEKLQVLGAKAVLVRASTPEASEVMLKPHLRPRRLSFGVPVVVISAADADELARAGRVRAKKMRLAHVRRGIAAMPLQGCVEVIADVYLAKLGDDERKVQGGRQRMPLRAFVKTYFRTKYGNSRLFARKYRSFLLGVLNELDSREQARHDDDHAHAWVTLFAQLVGIGTKSGRVVPLEPPVAHFVLDHLRIFEPILLDTAKMCPATARFDVQKKLTAARASRLLGPMYKASVRSVVHRAFTKYLSLSKRDEVYKVAMTALHALLSAINTHDGGLLDVFPCPAVLSLLAVTYSACDCPPFDVVDPPNLATKKPVSRPPPPADSGGSPLPTPKKKSFATPFR